jgi:hypothetical protein
MVVSPLIAIKQLRFQKEIGLDLTLLWRHLDTALLMDVLRFFGSSPLLLRDLVEITLLHDKKISP